MREPTPYLIGRRTISPFGFKAKIARFFWNITWALFFLSSPRIMHSWRRMLLRLFGAKISSTAHIYPGAKIWAPWNLEIGEVVGVADDATLYSQGRITLEDHVTISQEAYLCTGSHDYRQEDFRLWTAPILIKRNAWVAARAFIHPGVVIGEDAVVGACAVVTHDVPPGGIVAGNPAVVVKSKYENNKN